LTGSDGLKPSAANIFALSIAVGFLLPLGIPNVGIDYPYFFVTVIVLLAWFMIKWDAVKSITKRSRSVEIAAGLVIITADYVFNAFRDSSVGIIDLIVIFLGTVVLVFGFRSLKKFWVPATYGIVLLLGYQIENLTPNYSALQNWLASVMASSMNVLGIGAHATGQYVLMSLQNGTPLLLSLEGSCTGLQGILAFGMLSTMALLDVKPRLSRIAPIFVLGFLGAFLINIVRLFVVFLTFEFFGVDAGTAMHVYFGYLIFFLWVLVFWGVAFRYLVPRPVVPHSRLQSAASPGLREI
jgi:exosortase/archaeosortase family protein